MSKHQKSNRNAVLRQLRRRGLAALVIACGMLSTSVADETTVADEGSQKSEISLRLLPPLPVGIGQLSTVQEGQQTRVESGTSGTIRLRSNPYALPSTQNQPAAAGQRLTIRQVGIVPADVQKPSEATAQSARSDTSARLIRQPETTFSLRPVAMPNLVEPADQISVEATTPVGSRKTQVTENVERLPKPTQMLLPKVQENPWVTQAETVEAEKTAVATIGNRESATDAHSDWVQSDGEHSTVTTSAHFSLSDSSFSDPQNIVQASPASFDGTLRLKDTSPEDSKSVGVAPLLKVAAPTLLQVAQPVSIQVEDVENSGTLQAVDLDQSLDPLPLDRQARDGDVRSATGRVMPAIPTEQDRSLEISSLPIPTETATGAIVIVEEVTVSAEATPQRSPIVVEASEPVNEVPKAELPVPKIYRPKNSLVIEVPETKVSSSAHNSSIDKDQSGDESRTVFAGEASEVISVAVAQTQAFTPSDAVRKVQLENREICEAVLVGSHKLLLIGRSEGVTKLAVWCGADTQARLFEVHVVKGMNATPGTTLDSIATRLTETIAATYPNCRVRVVPDGEGLAVVGKASNAKSAREILRLVRSACLKSVSDQLEVR